MRCPNCQQENDDKNEYCSVCGAPLPRLSDEDKIRAIKAVRRLQFNMIANRVLMIASFISLILIMVSLFLPSIHLPLVNNPLDIGGLIWFTQTGIQAVNSGLVSVGPFYTTLVVYFIALAGTVTCVIFALNAVIKSYTRKTIFKGAQFIMLAIVINMVYHSLISSFYYYYHFLADVIQTTSQGIGGLLFDISMIVFLLPFCVHLLVNGTMKEEKEQKIMIVSIAILGFFIMRNYNEYFTSIGIVDYTARELLVEGMFNYFDGASSLHNMNMETAVPLIISIVFAAISFITAVFLFLFNTYSVYKKDKINPTIYFTLATINTISMIGYVVGGVFFSININTNPGFSNNYFYTNTPLVIMCLTTILLQTFATLGFVKSKNNSFKNPYRIYR